MGRVSRQTKVGKKKGSLSMGQLTQRKKWHVKLAFQAAECCLYEPLPPNLGGYGVSFALHGECPGPDGSTPVLLPSTHRPVPGRRAFTEARTGASLRRSSPLSTTPSRGVHALVPIGLSSQTFPNSWLVSCRPMFLASCLLEAKIAKCFLYIL